MGKIVLIYFFFIAISIAAYADADTTLHLVNQKTITGSYTNFYTDNFGNIFLVSKSNQIKKLNQDLDSVGVFNDVRRYGDIYSLDVNNPSHIIDEDGLLYLYDEKRGWLLFDYYGTYKQHIDLLNWKDVQVSHGN